MNDSMKLILKFKRSVSVKQLAKALRINEWSFDFPRRIFKCIYLTEPVFGMIREGTVKTFTEITFVSDCVWIEEFFLNDLERLQVPFIILE